MAFVKISKSAKGSAHTTSRVPSIRMASHLQSETMSARMVALYITQPVIEQVGWAIEEDERGRRRVTVSVNEGTGEDAGVLMLEHDPKGYVVGTSKPRSSVFSVAVSAPRLIHYVLNETPCELTDVEFVIDEETQQVMIQCPDWLRFNPQSMPPEKAPPVPVKTASVHDMHLNRQERRAVAKRITSRLK